MDSKTRNCQNCKKDFVIEAEDFNFYEKIKVPSPTFCWECRHQRRLSFRNERVFYKRNCDLCGNSVVSRVSPDKTYKMYCTKCWWSDKWDPKDYGMEIDFSRPFLEQWKELFFKVPHISIFNSNVIKQFISLVILKAQVNAYADVFLVSAAVVFVGAFLALFLKVKNERTDIKVQVE